MKIFAKLDLALDVVEVRPGAGFSTDWQRIDDVAEAMLHDAEIGAFVALGIQHSPMALEVYAADDLARFRILAADCPPPGDGEQLTGYALDVEGGQLVVTPAFTALPPPRRLIDKDVIMSRLDDANLVGVAQAALLRRPVLFGRWVNKDWPEVYADDEDLVAVLTAIGADVAEITAPL